MREVDRTRLIQANRCRVRRRFVCRLAMVLCLLSGVVGFTLVYELNLRVSDAGALARPLGRAPDRVLVEPSLTVGLMHRREPAGLGKLIPPASVVGPVASRREGGTGVSTVIYAQDAKATSQLAKLSTSNRSEDDLWRLEKKSASKRIRAGAIEEFGANPKFYRALSLNETAQRKLLSHAPMESAGEFTKAAGQTQVVMTLPMPDGTFARFGIEKSPVMAAELAARFPDIRTYRGRGLDDPGATTRLDVTPQGFHAIVLTSEGTVIIEPGADASRGHYISYDIGQKQRDAPQEAG